MPVYIANYFIVHVFNLLAKAFPRFFVISTAFNCEISGKKYIFLAFILFKPAGLHITAVKYKVIFSLARHLFILDINFLTVSFAISLN